MKVFSFVVTMAVENEVKELELKEYITNACLSWGGSFHPDNPLFGLDEYQIQVRRYVKRATS